MLIEICSSDDSATIAALLTALDAVGALSDEFKDAELGVGLNRFRVGADELTVYRDAWRVDLNGPDELVKRVLELLSSRAEYTSPR